MKKFVAILFLIYLCIPQFLLSQNKKHIEKIAQVYQFIDNMYVDSINENDFCESSIKSIVNQLDPHSTYITAKEANNNTLLKGRLCGIGISCTMLNDTLTIINVLDKSPAKQFGLRPSDQIIKIDHYQTSNYKNHINNLLHLLRGEEGSTIKIEVKRRLEPEKLLLLSIQRKYIKIQNIGASYMLNDSTGYIKINQFGLNSAKEFKQTLVALKRRGLKNLILDLQNNGGGYMSEAIDIANVFIKKGNAIVYMKGAHQKLKTFNANSNKIFKNGKLVITTNELSASSSEIISGAVQDWDAGVIVGRRTFGKGLVQQDITFHDKSILRLTIAHYYTPSGRCIQKPYIKGYKNIYEHELNDRFDKGEMFNADSVHLDQQLKYKTLVNHRLIYGGGGIMPDQFVCLDSTATSTEFNKLWHDGLILQAVFRDYNNNQLLLEDYPNSSIFYSTYKVKPSIINDILKKVRQDKNINQSLLKEKIAIYYKAFLAKVLYSDSSTFYRIINADNNIIQKAISIINSPADYNKLLH